ISGLEYYERKIVRLSADQVDINKLSLSPDTSYNIDTVFLQVVSTGKNVKLYSYVDDLKARYYIMDNTDNSIRELERHIYTNIDNSMVIKYLNLYRGQLGVLAEKFGKNTHALSKLIAEADYRQNELLRIVTIINGETENQFTPKVLFGTRLFVGVATVYNSSEFSGDIYFSKKRTSIFPKLSVGLDMLPNKNVQKLILRAELSITGDYHNFYDPGSELYDYPSKSLKVSSITASITPQIIYNIYNTNALKAYLRAGISINYSSYKKHDYVGTYNGTFSVTIHNFPQFQKDWETFPLSAGVVLNKRLELYVTYVPTSDIVYTYTNFADRVYSYQAGINYLFGSK
ncbi:MAG: hypothetical protein ACXVJN_23200, partial [Mucilaginibacter sp.]